MTKGIDIGLIGYFFGRPHVDMASSNLTNVTATSCPPHWSRRRLRVVVSTNLTANI